uniref:Uncharacterized protein LOC102806254 n=1 Tax=Saccoglossus kowalevskii TaxID=10224 RepID=A0ABM0LUM0_SACKO|nr:PREDICTED: uncharacterized protein LOC102806254 [Saccoglossus kowalevskii]
MSELAKLKEEVKKNLRALLISAPTGLTLQQIQNDYHTMLGQPIPYRELGYNTVTDFIKSVPDCLQTHYERGLLLLYGVADDTTKHIAKLVSRQKVGLRCRRGRVSGYLSLVRKTAPPPPTGAPKPLMAEQPSVPAHLRTKIKALLSAYPNAADQKDHPECVVDKNSPSKLTDLTQTTDDDEGGNESLNSSFISDSRVDDSIDDELKEQVRKILCKRPAGLWAAQLQPEYKQLTGKDLPLKPLGFYSVIELVSLIPDVVTIERPTNKGDWLLYDTRLYKKEKSKETATEKKTNVKTVDSCVKYNIWYVLSCHPNGIFLSNLQAVYMKHSEEIIYPQHLGFKDLLSLLKSIPDAVIVEERLTGHIVLHANKFFQPGPISEQLAAPKISPRRYVHKSVPPDAVGSGVGYSTVVIPAVDYLEVYLASVISPGNFCIQIKSDETSVALDIVMDALEKIYCSSESEHYQMPDCMLAVGQVCCAIYQQDSNWHRALITGVRDSEFIEVLYVDYGNIAIVPKSCLRLLKSCFLHLPAQAVQSRLANVKPTKSGWTRATRDRILELCKDKPLVALITGIKNEIISMCLCDTSGETDVHINDLLVAEGLAIFCPEKPLENTEDESQEPLKAPTEPVEDSTSVNLNDSQTDAMPAWTTVYNEENEYSLTKEDIELMEQMNQEIEGTTSIVSNEDIHEEVKGPQFVKKVDLTGKYKAHIIKYEDEPYLLSGQISSYLWEIDMLRAMMRQKTLRVKQVILAEKDHHELFDCIKRYLLCSTLNSAGYHAGLNSAGNHAGLNSACNHAGLNSAGNHAGLNSAGNHACLNSAGNHACLNSAGNHAGLNSAGNHAGLNSAGNHAGLNSAGNHAGLNSAGNHAGLNSAGNHAGLNSADNHAGLNSAGNHAGLNSADSHAGLNSAGNHAGLNSADNHAGLNSACNHACLNSVGNHAGLNLAGNHAGLNSAGNHAGLNLAGNHAGLNSAGNHAGLNSAGNHACLNSAGCMDGDVAKPFLTLYHLSCIPDILKLFKCPAEKLIDALEYEALQFDPEDDYWKSLDYSGLQCWMGVSLPESLDYSGLQCWMDVLLPESCDYSGLQCWMSVSLPESLDYSGLQCWMSVSFPESLDYSGLQCWMSVSFPESLDYSALQCWMGVSLPESLDYSALHVGWGEVVTHEDVKLGADEDVLIDLEYGLDDLKLLLQVMQFKRKRILKAMISDSDKHLVNELQFVEQQITDVRNAIQYRGYEDVKKEKETNSNDEICSPIVEELSKNEDEVQEEISQSSINNEGQISEKSDCQQATSSNNTMNKDDDKINEEDISEADLSRKVISNPQARVEPIMKDSVDNDQPSDAIEIEPSKSAPSNPSVSSLQSDMITYNQQNANQYQRCSSSQQQNSGQYPYCPTSQQNAGQYPLCPPEQENASQYPYCTTPQQNAGQYPLCPPQQHNTGQYQQNVGQYQCWPAQQHNAGQYHQNAGQYHQNAGQYHQNAGQYHQNASQYQQNAGQYHQNVGQYQQRSGYHNQRRSYGMQNQFAQNQYCNYPPRNFGPVSQNQQQMAAYNHMQQTQFGQFQNTNNFGQGRGKAQTLGYGYM